MRDHPDPPAALLSAADLVVGHDGVPSCAPVTLRVVPGSALAPISPSGAGNGAGPVVSTPMGVLPAGIGATSVQGLDVGLLGSLPVVVALLLDGPPLAAVVAVQWM
jgi:hypothetical protein